mgnify:CR=1 FL=1|jgi:hypothetical protein
MCVQEYGYVSCIECSGRICTLHATSHELADTTCSACEHAESDSDDFEADPDTEVEYFEPYYPDDIRSPPTTQIVACAGGTCAICLEELRHPVARTACNHLFHAACVSRWFDRAPTCPLCRN